MPRKISSREHHPLPPLKFDLFRDDAIVGNVKSALRENAATLMLLLASLMASGCASWWLLYPGLAESNDPHLDPRGEGHSYEEVAVTNPQNNKLAGWLFAAPADCGTVLIAGGNAQNISSTYEVSRYLIGNGFRVLIFSYQG